MKNLSSCLSPILLICLLGLVHRPVAAQVKSIPAGPLPFVAGSSPFLEPPLVHVKSPALRSSRGGVAPAASASIPPFSRVALTGSVSPLGIGIQATTNITRYFNVRGSGNVFNYTLQNIWTEGFNVSGKLNLATAGASLDYYPFHNGFRLSPGVQFYNQNRANISFLAPPGTSFSLSNYTFFASSHANALQGKGIFRLGSDSPALTATTGWGNTIPASGRHWTYPVEIGVAFIQEPTVALTLSGEVCNAQGFECQNVATDATAKAELAQQVSKYRKEVAPLKTFPIVSVGVAYNFRIRRVRMIAR